METETSSIDELAAKILDESFLLSVDIENGIEESTPNLICLPIHFRYVPIVRAKSEAASMHYVMKGDGEESPDYELVRLQMIVQSYENAFTLVENLVGKKCKHSDEELTIRINDLPIEKAQEVFKLYKEEFLRVKEEHKNIAFY